MVALIQFNPMGPIEDALQILLDSNHSLGQRWHFVGSFVGPKLTNDVGPMSFCSSGRL